MTIEAAAAQRGVDPFDLYFDLLVDERLGAALSASIAGTRRTCAPSCGTRPHGGERRAVVRAAPAPACVRDISPLPRSLLPRPRCRSARGHDSEDDLATRPPPRTRRPRGCSARVSPPTSSASTRTGQGHCDLRLAASTPRRDPSRDRERRSGHRRGAAHRGAAGARPTTSDDGGTMSGSIDTRLLAFMSDFTGEGTDNALAKIKDSGVGGVTVGARLPHRPGRLPPQPCRRGDLPGGRNRLLPT